jgi:cephalosporin hydroxylase
VLFQEERISTHYVDQLNFESLTRLSELVQQSQLIIDDGLHNPEANVNVLMAYMNVMQSGSWLVIEDISRDDFSLKLWMHIRMLISEFDSYILELSNKFMFIAKRR